MEASSPSVRKPISQIEEEGMTELKSLEPESKNFKAKSE
jgi:hypothetical protein